jgi:Zn-dependent protease/predicted transcriptional regulator
MPLARVSGITIYVHWTFLILLVVWGFVEVSRAYALDPVPPVNQIAIQVAWSLGFVLAIFACVTLHELGHALTAQRFGIHTRDIILLPIGGVARLERIPEEPSRELLIALAGPAVNVVIAGVIFLILPVVAKLEGSELGMLVEDGVPTVTSIPLFLANLAAVNVFLVVFNMLPAFPMDGGRVLRAILAMNMNRLRATEIASGVGQFMAIAFALLGLFIGNPLLLLIALFVYMGASAETEQVRMTSVLQGLPVHRAMMTEFRTLTESSTLSDAVDELLAGSQHDFPVVDAQGRLIGVLPRARLFEALADHPRETSIQQFVHRDCGRTGENESLEKLFEKMRSNQCPTVPVLRNGVVVGLVTLENIGELITIASVLHDPKPSVIEERDA